MGLSFKNFIALSKNMVQSKTGSILYFSKARFNLFSGATAHNEGTMNLESMVALTVMGILVYGISRIGFGSMFPFWIYCAGATCIAAILFHLGMKKTKNVDFTIEYDGPDAGMRNQACADCNVGVSARSMDRPFRCKLHQKEAKFENQWQWKKGREAVYQARLNHKVSKER